jgi:hypothetical protein
MSTPGTEQICLNILNGDGLLDHERQNDLPLPLCVLHSRKFSVELRNRAIIVTLPQFIF